MKTVLTLFLLMSSLIAQTAAPTNSSNGPSADELNKRAERFAPVELTADTSALSTGDKQAIAKLIEAAHIVDVLQLRQRWAENEKLWAALKADKSPLGRARLQYFWINKGPWDHLDGNKAFITDFPGLTIPAEYPAAGNFYPEDATKEELEAWMKSLPAKERDNAQWFFTVIRNRKGEGNFKIVNYSLEYRPELEKLSKLLKEAAALTDNASLKKFLSMRADAFLSNDYYDSDLAWMDLDSTVDVTIGPYETYNDELFGYKAAFEAYVNIRDAKETDKLKFMGQHMQEIENALPLDQQYKNPKIGAMAPMTNR